MPPQSNVNVVALQLEKVRDKVPLLYERDDQLLQMIQARGDVEKVSSRNMRIPLQMNPGGRAGSYDPDGGDLGRGSGTSYEFAQVTPTYQKFGVEITKLVEWATAGKERAVENAAKREVANGMAQFRSFLDKLAQTNGNGVLGTISSLSSTTATMAVPYGAQLVYNNQSVLIYDATLTINRSALAGFASTVLAADPISAQTIVFDALPPGTVATDVIVPDGTVGASPINLYGIKYQQSNATTGTWQNLNRATYPVQLATPRVNGNSGALVPMMPRLAINKSKKALGLKRVKGLIAYMAVEQSQAWEQLATTVQIIDRASRETGKGQDMNIRSYDGSAGTMSGCAIKEAENADQTRVDFLDLEHWGRAIMNEIDYYEVNGDTVFPIYGASGGLATAYIFYFIYNFQIFTDSPRSGSYIDALSRPAGY